MLVIPSDFLKLLVETGWRRVQDNEVPFWRHNDRPGRRFDTSCAVIEAMTMKKGAILK